MTPQRGRRLAIGAASLVVLLLAFALLALRVRLLAEWHIWKLHSPGEPTRRAASERLGVLRAACAVPQLCQCLRENANTYLPRQIGMAKREQLEAHNSLAFPGDDVIADRLHQLRQVLGINLAGNLPPEWSELRLDQPLTGSSGLEVLRAILRTASPACGYKQVGGCVFVGAELTLRAKPHDPPWCPDWDDLWAAAALSRIGKPAVPALVEMTADADSHVQLAAVYALLKIGPEATCATGALVKVLGTLDHGLVRALAASALAYIGSPGPGVIQALEQAESDLDLEVAGCARDALRFLRGGPVEATSNRSP